MSNKNIEEHLKCLEKLGYFKYVPPNEIDSARRQALANLGEGYHLGLSDDPEQESPYLDYRMFDADAEDLVEGGVGEILLLLKPLLKSEGFNFNTVEDEIDDEHYDILIDGTRYDILTPQLFGSPDAWQHGLNRLLEIVSGLLKECGSAERLYGLYSGNDAAVILLTEDMYRYIVDNNLFKSVALPYEVNREPAFG